MPYAMKDLFCTIALAVTAMLGVNLAASVQAAPRPSPYTAVATVGMIGDVVENVAGAKAEVANLIGEGVDPHLYKPTRGDLVALSRADIIFYNGLLLEGKMAEVLVRSARRGKPVIPVAEALLEGGDYGIDQQGSSYDPHLWMDVRAWIAATQQVAKSLSAFDPQNAESYKRNAERYSAELEKLDAYARQVLASVPEQQRVLVTAHDAFSYLGRAYGIRVRGIQGINTDSEAGVRDIENLVTFLVDNNIPAVFVESSVSDKNVRALIEGARARGHTVTVGGELFSDAMGAPGSYEGTYIGMIDHNVTTIARALGGEAPQKGFQGKLSHVR